MSLKIISVRQPWASLIVNGHKDVENRTWPTKYRGLVLIHASLRSDDITHSEVGVRPPMLLPEGGIVGITEIVDCVKQSNSRWHVRHHWGFVLANSRPLPFVKWKGALSIRDAPAELLQLLNLDQRAAAA